MFISTLFRACYGSCMFIFTMLLLVFILYACSSGGNRPSPFHADSTTLSGVDLKIAYGSPRVRGRKVFGMGDSYLVPFGELWRTGANEATVFSTSKDIMFDSLILPKGKYALFTVPGPTHWKIILNKDWDQWGAYHHEESLDVARLNVEVKKINPSQEKMELIFKNDKLTFRWEHIGWSIPINPISGSNEKTNLAL